MADSLFDCHVPELDSVAGYTIRKYVGRGAMAFVFKATGQGMNCPVAPKVLPAEHFTQHGL